MHACGLQAWVSSMQCWSVEVVDPTPQCLEGFIDLDPLSACNPSVCHVAWTYLLCLCVAIAGCRTLCGC
jgi:hypothetical protein